MKTCQRCGETGDDRRTLYMACLYAMDELQIPFNQVEIAGSKFFTLCVCKHCRADWMDAIQSWFASKPVRESPGTGIFVRRNGAVVEISEEEWIEKYGPGKPVRFKN